MHNATTKQRHAALKRKLGIFTGAQYWVRMLRERRARAQVARLHAAGAVVLGDGPAATALAPADLPPGPIMDSTRFAPELAAVAARDAELHASAGAPRRAIPLAAWAALAAALVAAGAFVAFAGSRPAPGQVGAAAAAGAPGREASAARAAPVAEPAAAEASPERTLPAGLTRGSGSAPGTITVRRGDTLWRLSGQQLGEPTLWPRIFAMNRDRVSNPDLIFPGQQIRIPAG